MSPPTEDEGYWLSCPTPGCYNGTTDALIFKVQVIGSKVHLHCPRCGRVRIVESAPTLHVDGMVLP